MRQLETANISEVTMLGAYTLDVASHRGQGRASGLTSAQQERVRIVMRQLRAERYAERGGVRRMAADLGVSTAAVSGATSDPSMYRPGFELALAVANLLGVNVIDLLGIDDEPPDPGGYRNRARAVRAARLLDVREDAIERVRAWPGSKNDVDRPALNWLKMMLLEAEMLDQPKAPRGESLNPPKIPLPPRPPRSRGGES
jgi:hypothetical protein